MNVTIISVSNRSDLRRFIDLPPQLYQGFDEYEPPMRLDRVMLLDPRKGAFFKRGKAQYWLALQNGKLVGRISAQIGQDTMVGVPLQTGMFGCLDTIDDRQVVASLIVKAEHWLTERGCKHILGPMLLDMNGEPGLLIEGFSEPAMILTPWHPPYLQAHLEELGFEKWRDLHSWRLNTQTHRPEKISKPLRVKKRRSDFTVRPINRRSMDHDIQTLVKLFNDGWRDNWGFLPLSEEDLHDLKSPLAYLLPPDAGKVVEIGGEPVAIMLSIPNMFELTAGIAPTPSVAGWLRLGLRALRFRPKSGRILLLGISSRLRYSAAGAAIVLIIIDEMVDLYMSTKPDWVEAGWILEDNDAMIKIIVRHGFYRNRIFRLFGKPLLQQKD